MSMIINKQTMSGISKDKSLSVNAKKKPAFEDVSRDFYKSLIKMQDLMANKDNFTDKYLEDIEYEARRLSALAHKFRCAKDK